jgi:hypothetical protein
VPGRADSRPVKDAEASLAGAGPPIATGTIFVFVIEPC